MSAQQLRSIVRRQLSVTVPGLVPPLPRPVFLAYDPPLTGGIVPGGDRSVATPRRSREEAGDPVHLLDD